MALNTVVISGADAPVTALADRFAQRGRRVHRLAVSHAFHSVLMEPMLEEFAQQLAGISAAQPRIDLVSNLTGQLAGPGYGSAAVLGRARAPAGALRRRGTRRRIRGCRASSWRWVPAGGLSAAVVQSLASEPAASVVTLAKDRPEAESLLTALGQLFSTGADVNWPAALGGGRRVDLPTYGVCAAAILVDRRFCSADVRGVGLTQARHPVLGAVVERPDSGGVVLTGSLSVGDFPWLADHVDRRSGVVPRCGIRGAGASGRRRGRVLGGGGADVVGSVGVAAGWWGSGTGRRRCVGRVGFPRRVGLFARRGRRIRHGCCTHRPY